MLLAPCPLETSQKAGRPHTRSRLVSFSPASWPFFSQPFWPRASRVAQPQIANATERETRLRTWFLHKPIIIARLPSQGLPPPRPRFASPTRPARASCGLYTGCVFISHSHRSKGLQFFFLPDRAFRFPHVSILFARFLKFFWSSAFF